MCIGEMDTATKQKAVSTHDMGKLQVDISTCKQNFILLFDTVKGVLDVIGVRCYQEHVCVAVV